jgi:release factor glutamine methyltransferase
MMAAMPTAGEILHEAEAELKASNAIEHPHPGKELYDAEELLRFVLGREPEADEAVDSGSLRRFRRLLARRAGGEPVGYLTGSTEFGGMRLAVGHGAFIPRESSEFMVEQAARRLRRRQAPVHVDVATGVGPVALAVARAVPHARVLGVDLYARPVALARRNARKLGLSNVRFLRGDLFTPLPQKLAGRIDVVTVHPPYVGRRELKDLPHEILLFEPEESLTDRSPAGMGLLGRTALEAPGWLRPGGWLLVEVSPDRSRSVGTVLRRAGFTKVRSTKGGVGVSRVVVGRR